MSSWRESSGLSFNLKNQENKRYLGWKGGQVGVNLGYSPDATSETARRMARWFFKRPSGTGPIRYGEPLAMGYGTSPSFYRYTNTFIGVNLENTGTPAYEWRVLGAPGTVGTPVRTGQKVAIFNDVEADFLIRFDRDAGVDLGWPTSRTWFQQGRDTLKKVVLEAVEEYIKAQLGG